VKYEVEAGDNPASSVTLDINGPRFILAADPLYALMDFAILDDDEEVQQEDSEANDRAIAHADKQPTAAKSDNAMAIQLNVNDASVLLLASDSVKNSGLIELRIAQMVLTKQVSPE
jgi:vacuolar protein sorting-associated protein 13A/C